MTAIKCNEVWVRFTDRNKNGERLTRTDIKCDFLVVQKQEDVLTVYYCVGIDGNVPVKSISYNYSTVSEFTCESIITPPAKSGDTSSDSKS